MEINRKHYFRSVLLLFFDRVSTRVPVYTLSDDSFIYAIRVHFEKKLLLPKYVVVEYVVKGFVLQSRLSTMGGLISTCFASLFIFRVSVNFAFKQLIFLSRFLALSVSLSAFLKANLSCNVKYWFRKACDVNSSKSKGSVP